MTSNTRNSEQVYSDQLSNFESQLKHTMDDSSLLQDVHRAIRELLKEHHSSETDIRKILLAQLDAGSIRQESYQLVRTMLDRIVSDEVDTLPEIVETSHLSPHDFGETDVIAGLSSVEESAEDQLQIGSVLRDRFLLQKQVAGGSMGVVYKALDRRLAEADTSEPWVAIKVLSPRLSRNGNALRALQQEAAKGRCLTHPNIVRFLDLDRDDEVYFIVMEWLDGRSLADILDDAGSKKLDLKTALDIVGQLGAALDYAHRCGVIHADVKPANVMIVPSGQVKLFDFGVARIRQKQSETVTKFDPAVLGAVTPAYSSMQVLTGDEPVPTDDVFSLACLFYRMVAGYRVFGPRNAAEAAESGMEPQRPQGLNAGQWKALRKALGFSRVARYSSIQAFVDDLKSDQSDESPALKVSEPMVDSDDTLSPRRWPLVIAVVGLVAALAWIGTQTSLLDDYLPAGAGLASSEILPDVMPGSINSGTTNGLVTAAEHLADNTMNADAGVKTIAPVDTMTILPNRQDSPVTDEASDTGVSLEQSDELSLDEPELGGDGGPAKFEPDEENVATLHDREPAEPGVPELQRPLGVGTSQDPWLEPAVSEWVIANEAQSRPESGLPPNTVVFWRDRVTVRESDSAVQIDVLRLNPDAGPFAVEYIVRDISASEGEDYFAPGVTTLFFGVDQTTIRLLIPLVQDSLVEADEVFLLDIDNGVVGDDVNINRRITVMIQDDDIAAPQ